jgi:DNA-binding GntR family transcriptional regulator
VGSRLPNELELAERYGLSRTTVRSALQHIERLGLVSRRRKLGTTVTAERPPAAYTRSLTTLEDLVQYATEVNRDVLTSPALRAPLEPR